MTAYGAMPEQGMIVGILQLPQRWRRRGNVRENKVTVLKGSLPLCIGRLKPKICHRRARPREFGKGKDARPRDYSSTQPSCDCRRSTLNSWPRKARPAWEERVVCSPFNTRLMAAQTFQNAGHKEF